LTFKAPGSMMSKITLAGPRINFPTALIPKPSIPVQLAGSRHRELADGRSFNRDLIPVVAHLPPRARARGGGGKRVKGMRSDEERKRRWKRTGLREKGER